MKWIIIGYAVIVLAVSSVTADYWVCGTPKDYAVEFLHSLLRTLGWSAFAVVMALGIFAIIYGFVSLAG